MSRTWAITVPDEPEGVHRVWDSDGDEWRKDGDRWRLVRKDGTLGDGWSSWGSIIADYGPMSDQPKD